METRTFYLFPTCFPVKGVSRSIIYDIQRNSFEYIPNELYHILIACNGSTIAKVKATCNPEQLTSIDAYFSFLVEHEFIFFDSPANGGNFPLLSREITETTILNNAIIDGGPYIIPSLLNLLFQLEQLGCQFVQFRFFDPVDEATLRHLKLAIQQFDNMTYELFLPHSLQLVEMVRDRGFEQCSISRIVIHGSPEEGTYDNTTYVSDLIEDKSHCGIIHPLYFTIDQDFFLEANSFNSCLYKKVSIDKDGYIKNCPSMSERLGHVTSDLLRNIILHPAYIKMAGIKKDEILVCKDCEYRYMCSDCRAYLEQPENPVSKPLKCGYDPYTTTWQDWANNPAKKDAIVAYHLNNGDQKENISSL